MMQLDIIIRNGLPIRVGQGISLAIMSLGTPCHPDREQGGNKTRTNTSYFFHFSAYFVLLGKNFSLMVSHIIAREL